MRPKILENCQFSTFMDQFTVLYLPLFHGVNAKLLETAAALTMRPQAAKKVMFAINEPSQRRLRSFEPLRTLSRLVGISVYTDSADGARIIISCIVFVGGQIAVFFALQEQEASFHNSLDVHQIGFVLSYTTPSIVFCSQLILFWRNQQFFSSLFSRVVVYNTDSSYLYYPKAWTIIGLGFPLLVFLADMYVMPPSGYFQCVAVMLHAFGFSASYFPLLIFGSILEVLDTRVIQLTDSIKFSTTPPLLLALCEEINDLTNMIRRLSSFYGPTILICFVFFFNDLIWCCYYSVILLFDEGPYNKIVLYQAGAVYHLFAFFLMSKACEDHYRRVSWESAALQFFFSSFQFLL